MPIHVRVLAADDWRAWVEEQRKMAAARLDDPSRVWALADLIERGARVYASNCAVCHLATGQGAGAIKPLDGSAVVLHDPIEMMQSLLDGRAEGAMPSWRQLNDTELAAVMTFAMNNWSNRTGRLVQPLQFSQAREGQYPEGADAFAVEQ